jgi:hypothetical protein
MLVSVLQLADLSIGEAESTGSHTPILSDP